MTPHTYAAINTWRHNDCRNAVFQLHSYLAKHRRFHSHYTFQITPIRDMDLRPLSTPGSYPPSSFHYYLTKKSLLIPLRNSICSILGDEGEIMVHHTTHLLYHHVVLAIGVSRGSAAADCNTKLMLENNI